MDIIRKELSTSAFYPAFLRYDEATDTVQSTPDNGATWVDAPGSDPRRQTSFPPPETDHPQCDAAARMVAHMQEILDHVIVGFTGGALAIIGSVLALFFPGFALLIAAITIIINGLIGLGLDDLNDFAESSDWTTLLCILRFRMGSNGQLNDASWADVLSDVDAQITGVNNTIVHYLLEMSGWGGLNYAASVRTEIGDCSSCPTTFDYFEHFLTELLPGTTPGGDNVHLPADYAYGATAYSLAADGCSDTGNWLKGAQSPVAPTVYIVQVTIDLGQERAISNISFLQYKEHSTAGHEIRVFNQAGEVVYNKAYAVTTGGTGCISFSQNLSVTGRYITLLIAVGSTTLKTYLSYIRVQGSI